MKNLLLPLLIVLAGAGLLAFSFVPAGGGGGSMDIEIEKAAAMMPAAHNVYSNELALNGKYYLFKAKLTNTTGAEIRNVKVEYRIPNYIDWTEVSSVGAMLPGQVASIRCHPKFPESVVEKTTESMEKAEIRVTWDGASSDDIIEEEFPFKLTGRKEFKFTNIEADEIAGWGDVYDNLDLLACFVTPNDPVVQYYTQNIQEKILKGEAASVNKKPEEAVRFLAGIYNATLLSHMVYSGTKGIPASLQDVSQFSQENRLPREVITGNTGLCLELSLLYASILSNAGLDPVIYIIPGHAYPGFVLNGQYYAIEATGIGGEGLGYIASAEKAFEAGQKQLMEFMQYAQQGDPRYKLVNIHELNLQGGIPMSLKDDQFLREKVDKIAASWTQMQSDPTIYAGRTTAPNAGGNQPQPVPNTPSPDNINPPAPQPQSGQSMSIAIPNNWKIIKNPIQGFHELVLGAISPDQKVSISIFEVSENSYSSAMNQIVNRLESSGQDVNYQNAGNEFQGVTYNPNDGSTLMWIGKAVPAGNKIRVITVGAMDFNFQSQQQLINQLYNTIQ